MVRYLSGKSGAVKPIEDQTRSGKYHRDARDVAGEFIGGGRHHNLDVDTLARGGYNSLRRVLCAARICQA
jgi:hypothetical protein